MSGNNRVTTTIGFPLSSNNNPAYLDGGQGAASRIASWMAWTADPCPMLAPQTTAILRDESFAPVLDGSSTGSTSGGDNAFVQE